eukprot:IDg12010t1
MQTRNVPKVDLECSRCSIFSTTRVRYEVAVSLEGGRIVWAHGALPCGEYSDIRIFRSRLKSMLGPLEFVIGDSGYKDDRCIQPPGPIHPLHRLYGKLRARHE